MAVLAKNIQEMKFRIAASAAAEAPPPPGEEEGYAMSGGYIWAPITLALCSMPLVAIGSCLILWGEPVAAGSGIPEVKSYLQGVRLPRMLLQLLLWRMLLLLRLLYLLICWRV